MKEQTQMMSQKRKDNKHELFFAIIRAYQFLLLLSLASIPTPSSSYTNRPLWVRALLTSTLD
jgi:hypothetical protein